MEADLFHSKNPEVGTKRPSPYSYKKIEISIIMNAIKSSIPKSLTTKIFFLCPIDNKTIPTIPNKINNKVFI